MNRFERDNQKLDSFFFFLQSHIYNTVPINILWHFCSNSAKSIT